jgi:hypothetical protein
MRARIDIHENALRHESLRAVGAHGIDVIKVPVHQGNQLDRFCPGRRASIRSIVGRNAKHRMVHLGFVDHPFGSLRASTRFHRRGGRTSQK